MTSSDAAIDLEIRIRTETTQANTRLNYVLTSPNGTLGFGPISIPCEPFAGQPDAYKTALFEKIELLRLGFDIDGKSIPRSEIATKLEGLGRDLYHDLFPQEMRDLYREFRGPVKTVLIVSDEHGFHGRSSSLTMIPTLKN